MNLPKTDHLLHAYGFATDATEHLTALTGFDEAAKARAIYYLASAIMHQGTPWPATGPIARYVAEIVANDGVTGEIRDALLDFLDQVAEATELAHDDGGEAAIRARVEATGRDLATELERVSASGLEVEFDDDVFCDMVLAHAHLGVLAAEPEVRAAFERG